MNILDDFKTVAHNIRVKRAYVAVGGVAGVVIVGVDMLSFFTCTLEMF